MSAALARGEPRTPRDLNRADWSTEFSSVEAAHPPDLVLLDMAMPEVNGLDVMEALRADPHARDTPVLIVTAKELAAAEKAALKGHVALVLRKGAQAIVDRRGPAR